MMPPMPSSKILAEKLATYPELEKRVSELIDIVEAESGHLDRADEAENREWVGRRVRVLLDSITDKTVRMTIDKSQLKPDRT